MPLLLAPAAAPPALNERLADLRRRWRRLALAHAIFAITAVALGAAIALGLIDRAVHLPALIRAAALVLLVAGAGLFLIRLVRHLRTLNDDLAVALRVEEHFPVLNDALASTVQFDRHPFGSEELRQATRRYAVREAGDCDFREMLDRRPVRRSFAALALALAGAIPLVMLFPGPTRAGLVRLIDPFGDHPWPPQTVLTLDAADWLARGEPFVLHGSLSGVIPERAMFGFVLDGTAATEQPVPITPIDDGGSLVIRLEPNKIPRSFRYRVRANDAETTWKTVRVLPPPQLAALDGRPSPQIHLDFPAYTDLSARDLPDGGGSIECVTGTIVHIRGATDRPVAHAWVEMTPDPPRSILAAGLLALGAANPAGAVSLTAACQAVCGRVPALLDAAGDRFEVTFRPYVGGLYALRFEDETGLGGKRTLDVRVLPDPSPAITLERPAAGFDSLSVLPDATLPLIARADDPIFAVRSAWLEFRCGKDEPTQRLPLYDHLAFGSLVPRMFATVPVPPLRLRLQTVPVERRLEVRRFHHADGRPLRDGDTLTLQVVADDFDDVTVPKPPGRSHEVELHVVKPSVLLTELQKAEANIQRELKEMLQLQRDALERTTPAETQRRQAGTLRPEDQERLIQAEQMQQQLRARIGNDREGLRAEVDKVKRAMRDNPLPRTPERDRLDGLTSELDRLAREDLDSVEPLLNQARKERGPISPEARKSGPLPKAIEHQREAERTLRDLLDQMQPWTEARELRSEAGALLQDQEKAKRDRADLEARGAIGKAKEQLPSDQQEQLDRLAERQSALADRSAELLGKLNRKQVEKHESAMAKTAEADAKEKHAAELERQAKEKPAAGSPKSDELRKQAGDARQQAQDAREAAETLKQEADALAAAREATQQDPAKTPSTPAPRDPSLPGRQREAAESVARNEVGQARQAQEAAERMLKSMQDKLEEKGGPDGDRLAKKKKLDAAERDLEKLIGEQEQLQKRADEAAKIADPAERKHELEKLSREQEQLQQEARDLAQRLTRLRGEQAGQELRRASRAMDQARDAMEQGQPAGEKQDDALDRLDDAQEQLAQNRKAVEEELQREMRAKMLDALKGLKERQESQVAESERLFQAAKEANGWSRPLQKSLSDMAAAEATLGGEVEPLIEKHFQDAKVIAHLVRQAAEALAGVEPAVEKVRNGLMDGESLADDRRTVQDPQRLALKRLTQLMDVLKDDEKDAKAGGGQPGQPGDAGSATGGGGAGDGIPPLAQLKLLRTLQAEINDRTGAFDKAHPDRSKLTEPEQGELDALRTAQADLAALLDELTPDEPPPEPPAKEKP
jgi:hypothetical protein